MRKYFSLLLIFFIATSLYSQEIVRNYRGINIDGVMSLGNGFDEIEVFYRTSDGRYFTTSAGGGLTLGIRSNIELSKDFEIEFGAHYRNTYLNAEIGDVISHFRNYILETGINYTTNISDEYIFKIGGGANYNLPIGLKIDDTRIINDNILPPEIPKTDYYYKYENAFGYYAQTEVEYLFTKDVAVSFGFKYYSMYYKIKSGTQTEYFIDPATLPIEIPDEHYSEENPISLDDLKSTSSEIEPEQYRKLNGSGINVFIGIGYRF